MAITRKQIATRISELERSMVPPSTDASDPGLSSRWLMTLSDVDLQALELAMVDGDEAAQQAFSEQFHQWIRKEESDGNADEA